MLTDQSIKQAISRAKADGKVIAIRDAGKCKGLELRVTTKGTATFAYVYKDGGAIRRLWLGNYGSAFTLADARRATEIAQGKRAAGIDPVAECEAIAAKQKQDAAERKALEEEQARRIIFDKLADLYFGGTDKHRTYRQMYDLNLSPALGKRVVAEIRRGDIQRIVDEIVTRGAPTQAIRVFELARAMLRWGISRDYLTGEPWRGVDLPPSNDPRTRVLTAGEIRWLWNAGAQRWAEWPNTLRIIRLQLLLGQRSGEIAGMEAKEISSDLMMWTIPAERTKNGVEHRVPLPPAAREIVKDALAAMRKNGRHVFVGARGKPYRSDGIAHDIADLIAHHNKEHPDQPVEHFTPHDLRRSVATGLEHMGIPLNTISATLNHISGKRGNVTSAHYAHADLSMEIRAALTRWQATVEAILAGADPFVVKHEDIHDLETRMLAKGYGGPARLRVVS